MTNPGYSRDLVPPARPAADPVMPAGLMLGIDIEELYCFFGDGEREIWRGLGAGAGIQASLPPVAAKLSRVRDTLLSLPDGAALVRQFDEILADASVSTADPASFDEFVEETVRLERRFDALMTEVRQALPGDTGYWYDQGIFLARLHLCLLHLESATLQVAEGLHETYLEEFRRVAPLFAEAFQRLAQRPAVHSAPVPLLRALVALLRDLPEFDESSTDWFRTVRQHSDDVFTVLGITHSGKPLILAVAQDISDQQDKAAADVADVAAQLTREHARYRAALFGNQPETAEEGLRTLLATARRDLGPAHWLVYWIQSDLSKALMVLGRIPLCTDLALDAVDEAALHLGDRHPVTAAMADNACRMLHITGAREEAMTLFDSRLRWLLEAAPDDLSDELRSVRDYLSSDEGERND